VKRLLFFALTLAGCVAPAKEPVSSTPFAQAPEASRRVAASDPHVRATGRVDRRDPNAPSFAYPGVTFELAFEGEGLTVELDDSGRGDAQHTNHYQVVVDGEPTVDLAVKPGTHEYTLASGLEPGKHHVALYKKTEAFVGLGTLRSFGIVGSGAKPLALPPRPARRLEFIGDSITCGYGNRASIEPPPRGNPSTGFTSENEDHYLSYGALAARALQAELHTVCISGIGVTRDYGGKTSDQMPALYGRTLPFEPEPAWDFSSYAPHAVVINLGTNDFGQGIPDQATFEQAYEAFLQELRGRYPDAHLACITGSMLSDTWPPGEERLTKINRWVSGIVERRKTAGDAKISFFALTPQSAPFGEDWHPTLDTHARMAREITGHLREALGW
jgi:lysophospholipase L1-like esterase